eukprot:maker-scaffold_11-snap-gene-4.44-mRNA-1 protein AED:0.04 eAED:0.04 QI:59/1/1/1/0/0/3/117/494
MPRIPFRPQKDEIQVPFSLELGDREISYLLGKKGATKEKLQRLCNAELRVRNDSNVLDITGGREEVWRGACLVSCLLQDREGCARLDLADDWPPLTLIPVPPALDEEIGSNRFLRDLESEFKVLLFHCKAYRGEDKILFEEPYKSVLCAFGTRRGRIGANLRLLSSFYLRQQNGSANLEKIDDYFAKIPLEDKLKSMKDEPMDKFDTRLGPMESGSYADGADNWGMDQLEISDEDYGYVLGKKGSTKKKLANASGALIEYFDKKCVVLGYAAQRSRAKEYLEWMLKTKHQIPITVQTDGRDDCIVLDVDSTAIGFIQGKRGQYKRDVESFTQTLIFMQDKNFDTEKPVEPGLTRFLICGNLVENRNRARGFLCRRVDEKFALDEQELRRMSSRGRHDESRSRSSFGRRDRFEYEHSRAGNPTSRYSERRGNEGRRRGDRNGFDEFRSRGIGQRASFGRNMGHQERSYTRRARFRSHSQDSATRRKRRRYSSDSE